MLWYEVRSDVERADKRAEGTEKVEVEAGGSLLFGGRHLVAAAAFLLLYAQWQE
jgi:hypothetical protein